MHGIYAWHSKYFPVSHIYIYIYLKDGTCYINISKIQQPFVMSAVPPKQETETAGHPLPCVTQFTKLTKLTVRRPPRRKPGLSVMKMELVVMN